jgi:cytochrome c biogenesis protein CcmG/thiol:disulfide interchange protein DsbE
VTRKAQWLLVGGAVAAAAAALIVLTRTPGGAAPPVEAGARAPDFHAVQVLASAPSSAAKPVAKSLADYKGQVVLLNIWATWCNPCRAEMPGMEKLREALEPKGLKIVAVSIDNPGMEPAIRDFVKELGLHFEILYDPDGHIRDDYQTSGAPETFVIGRDGVIRKRVIGATDWDAESQQALLRQLLAEPGA